MKKCLHRPLILLSASLSILSACSNNNVMDSGPAKPVDVSHVQDAVPRVEIRTRAGNPPQYTVLGKQYIVMAESTGYKQRGVASWYGRKFHGKKTANGEIYDMYAMTAAHKTLPIPSYVQVVNQNNQRSVILRINDRGPFKEGRIIDLSYAAAVKLGIDTTGTAPVIVTAIEPDSTTMAALPGPNSRRDNMQISSSSPVFLKVGAFRQHQNALRLKDKLRQAALPVQVTVTANPDESQSTISRLYVGPLKSEQAVQQTAAQLKSLGVATIDLAQQSQISSSGVIH